MCVKLPPRDLNPQLLPSPPPPHPTRTCTCRVTITPKVCGGVLHRPINGSSDDSALLLRLSPKYLKGNFQVDK